MSQGMQTMEQALMESMKHLMLAEPFEKITVKEITDYAHVKRPTFYNHFKDKYDVVERILMRDIVNPAQTLVNCNMIHEALRLMLVTMKKEQTFYMRASKIEGDNSFHQMLWQALKRVLLDVMKERMTDVEYDNPMLTVDNIAEYYSYSMTFGIFKWIQEGMRVNVDDVCSAMRIMLSESLMDIIYQRKSE